MGREPVLTLSGVLGLAGHREVLLGFAPANLLHEISFADVLDEDTGRGYQRRFNSQHSLDFRRYIQRPDSSTIPLTFNARPCAEGGWRLVQLPHGMARLEIPQNAGKMLAQVDCQHRLGYLIDLDILLPFMCYIGLSQRDEMEIFKVINSKAKGLSTSLLDFHEASLSKDLAAERPELFIALQLNNSSDSPWYRQLDLGGTTTTGLMRRASLRTMQKAIKRFLRQSRMLQEHSPEVVTQFVLDFWGCVSALLRNVWDDPRHHLLNKGIGVYALMSIAADIYEDGKTTKTGCDKRFIISRLAEFIQDIDWSSNGPLSGLGGESGVKAALVYLRNERRRKSLRVVSSGQ